MPECPIEPDAAGAIILERLAAIEQTEAVRILYACESGSRAWGFASPDSDYDVRFIYVRPRDWYLSIDLECRRDVIERPIAGVLDINGWDLRKALQFMHKSNPPLFEWLHSPLVYRAQAGFREAMQALTPAYYSPTGLRLALPAHGARQRPGLPARRAGATEKIPVCAAPATGGALAGKQPGRRADAVPRTGGDAGPAR